MLFNESDDDESMGQTSKNIFKPQLCKYRTHVSTEDISNPIEMMVVDVYALDRKEKSDYGMYKDYTLNNLQNDQLYEKYWQKVDEKGRNLDFQQNQGFPQECIAHIFGCTATGQSVLAKIPFRPFHFVEIPESWTSEHIRIYFDWLSRKLFPFGVSKVKYELISRKKFYGWVPDEQNPKEVKKFRMMQVSYPTKAHLYWANKIFTTGDGTHDLQIPLSFYLGRKVALLKVHETKVALEHKIFDQNKWTTSGWLRIEKYDLVTCNFVSSSQLEIECTVQNIKSLHERTEIAPITVLCYDLETRNPNDKPPIPTEKDCHITMIGATVYTLGQDFKKMKRIMFSLLDVSKQPTPEAENEKDTCQDIEFRCFAGDEKKMLLEFRDFACIEVDPDVITGYNISGYDWKYLMQRFNTLVALENEYTKTNDTRFFFWSRFSSFFGPLKTVESSSQQKGDRLLYNVPLVGRISMDMMMEVIASNVSDVLKLDHIAELLLKKRKIDLTMQDMFKLYEGRHTQRFLIENPRMTLWIIDQWNQGRKILGMETFTCPPLIEPFVSQFKLDIPTLPESSTESEILMHKNDCIRMHEENVETEKKERRKKEIEYGNELVEILKKAQFGYGHIQGYDMEKENDNEELFSTSRKIVDNIGLVLRRRLGEYCSVDCDLPVMIMDNLNCFTCGVQMSRITHTLLNEVLNRGQQIRIFQLLIHYCHQNEYIMNEAPKESFDGKYSGAFVLDPISRYYPAIITLDFASLYPSIMRGNMYCPTTLVLDKTYCKKLSNDIPFQHCRMDSGAEHVFVQHMESISFKVLTTLLSERKRVKQCMENEKDPVKYRNLNAEQLADKVVCNSLYGFFGVNGEMAMIPCRAVAESVTTKGREMIMKTKELIEKNFSNIGARIVYGDTDSVMVYPSLDLKKETETLIQYLERLFTYGHTMSKLVTDYFTEKVGRPVIKLEFEKVYTSYMLYQKKTYGGLKYESLKKAPKIDIKGIKLVKSDTCEFVRKIQSATLTPMFSENNFHRIVDAVNRFIVKFDEGAIPDDDFITFLKYGGNYKEDSNISQCVIVEKIKKRTPGSEPKPGDIVGYLPIVGQASRLYEKVEDPAYVKEKNLKVDYVYIIENRLVEAMNNLLQFTPINVKKLLAPLLLSAQQKCNLNETITSMFSKNEKQPLKLYSISEKEMKEFTEVKQKLTHKIQVSLETMQMNQPEGSHGNDDDVFFGNCTQEPKPLKRMISKGSENIYKKVKHTPTLDISARATKNMNSTKEKKSFSILDMMN